MARSPQGRREVMPSREAMGERRKPSFGSRLNVSVPISFGLPLIVVGLFVIITAVRTDQLALWILGGAATVAGILLFASGKRL
jgi:ABC-type phosphate transport system permease subunit